MTQTFVVKGISPTTRYLEELRLEAENAADAKRRAEGAGYEKVTVRPLKASDQSPPPKR